MPLLVYADRQQHEMETFRGGHVRPIKILEQCIVLHFDMPLAYEVCSLIFRYFYITGQWDILLIFTFLFGRLIFGLFFFTNADDVTIEYETSKENS